MVIVNGAGQPSEWTEWYTAEEFWIHPETEATEIRGWDGTQWTTLTGDETWYVNLSLLEEGDYSFFAQAGNPQTGEWDNISSIVTIHVTRRVLPEPSFTTNVEDGTFVRGNMIRVTIGDDPVVPEGQDTPDILYSASLYVTDNQGYVVNQGNAVCYAGEQMVFPTDHIPAGSCQLTITWSALTWEGNSRENEFTMTEPGNPPASFRVSSTHTHIGDPIETSITTRTLTGLDLKSWCTVHCIQSSRRKTAFFSKSTALIRPEYIH